MKKFYSLKFGLLAFLVLLSVFAFCNIGQVWKTIANKANYPALKNATTLLHSTVKKTLINLKVIDTENNSPHAPTPTTIRILPQSVNLLTTVPENIKILSINNSLIDYNDQADIFNRIAIAKGKKATWIKQTRLGKSLRYHYEEGEGTTAEGPSAKLTIRSQPWTHIILQEQSDKPLTNATDFLASIKLWQAYIKNYCPNPNAKIIIAMNWAYVNDASFTNTTQTMYSNYMKVAKETGLTVAPIGNAYEKIRQTDGETAKNNLYSDDRHPTLLASYLAACTQYATIFDSSPIDISYYPSNISNIDASRMQNWAWNIYNEHEDIVNDNRGTVRFHYEVLDEFNQPIPNITGLTWSVNGGGSIDNNGVFTRIGNDETMVTVTAHLGNLSGSATINLVSATTGTPQQPAVEISGTTNYMQTFDAIGNSAGAILPNGWKIEKNITAPRTLGSYNISSNVTEQIGGNAMVSNAPNGIYNFAAGLADEANDRAIGGISTGVAGGTKGINIYLKAKNIGSTDLHALDISYDVEKYRMGANGAGFTVQLYYSHNGETWFSAGNDFRTFFAADGTTTGYSNTPGATKSVNATLHQEVPAGEILYFAWNYSVDSGSDMQGAQALGIDNVSIGLSQAPPVVNFASITATNGYSQNFDILPGNTVANLQPLPLGWKIERIFSSPRVLGSFNAAAITTDYVNGTNMASNASNGTYNFGSGATIADAANAADRAIGGISTGVAGGTRSINIYLKIKNTGPTDINALTINYDIEKYRQGANTEGFVIQLYYSSDGENWTSAGNNFRTFFAADGTTAGYSIVPGDVRNISANLPQNLNTGKTIYLAWNYAVNAGTEALAAQALAIDNISIQAISTLPLAITSFTTRLTGFGNKKVVLDWATAQEENIHQFEIERSVDRSAFKLIGSLPAKNKPAINQYLFTDNSPLPGTTYYRVKQLDKDGHFFYSDVRSIKIEDDLQVYPNPIITDVNINIPIHIQGGIIKIRNTTGKTIFTKEQVKANEKISFSSFGAGVYILEIIKGKNRQSIKLLKILPSQ